MNSNETLEDIIKKPFEMNHQRTKYIFSKKTVFFSKSVFK